MRKILHIIFLVFIVQTTSAQHQVFELMDRRDLSIYQVQQFADRYFETVGTGRGTGYKQYQRWLYERKFHVDVNGFYIDPKIEWNNFLQARAGMTARTTAGSWTPMGPSGWTYSSGWNPGTGRLSAIAVHPANESIIYVGSPGGGLWKTTNAGVNWTPLTDDNATWMSIFALTIDPLDQNTIYMGTSTGLLMKSTNAGISWNPTGAGPAGTIRKVLVHPTSNNIVFACATNGIFRSVNGGTNWTQVHASSKEDIEFKPNDPNIMYASGNDVVRSINMGVNWTTLTSADGITNTGRTLVAVSAADPEVVYACQANGSQFGRMYRSANSAVSFVTTVIGSPGSGTNYFGYEASGTGTGGQATYDMALDVNPANPNDIHIAGIIVWRSTNGGNAFTAQTVWSYPNPTGYNHADVHGLFWVNTNLYSISDGGIYKSTDLGDNWTDLSTGLNIRQFYRIALSQTNEDVITGGAQDNGSVARQSTGNWVDWLGADGMEGLVSPTDHLKLWGTSQNGGLYRSINGGNSYSNLPRPNAGDWVTPLAIHPTNDNILYGGWTGVWKSVNSGSSWTNIGIGTITSLVTDLAIAPSAPTTIYASRNSTLWVTTNDGGSWTTRTAPSTINDIAVDPTDPNKIWIACNSATNRIMVSTDAGATFTNVSLNLPSIVARAIVVDDATPRNLYVGMNIGVFHKEESAGSWNDYSDNLPLVAINELEIQKNSGKIRVATYGRGVWESPLADAAGGFSFNTPSPTTSACPAASTMAVTLGTIPNGAFSNPITLSATAGVPAGTTVSFAPNPVTPGSSVVVTLNNTNTLAAGTYTITITGIASGASTQTRDISFVINTGTGPVITSEPVSQSICAGLNTTFSVSATGALSYQWQMSNNACASWTNLSNASPYSGVTTSTLTITGATAGMNDLRYRVVINGQCGITNSTSCAVLTVGSPATITAQPQSVTLCAGATNTFCVNATGANLTYQWEASAGGCGPVWDPIVGATSSCYTATAVSTTGIRCRITGLCSAPIVTDCALMTVATAVSVTTQPSNSTICAGNNTSFTVAGSGSGIIYQWQVNTGSGFVNIPVGTPYFGITTATLNITGATASMNGYQYRAQLSNSTCTTPGISNAATLTVNALPAITTSPTDATVCFQSAHTFSVNATGAGLTYQWRVSTNGGVTYSDIGGATSSSYTISAVTPLMNNNRYLVVVSGTCAPPVTSSHAILTVISPVIISNHPVDALLCDGGNTSFSVSAAGTGIVYQWQVSTDGGSTYTNISGANSATLNLNNVTRVMSGNRYRVNVSTPACTGSTPSNSALLTVHQLPSVGLIATKLNLLPGNSSTLTAIPAASTGGTLSISWFYNGTLFNNPFNTYVANIEKVGAYQVRVNETWPDGSICTNLSNVITLAADVSSNLFIFPSPNNGSFIVSYYNSGGVNTSRTVTVYDSKGSKVYHSKFNVSGPYTLTSIDISPAAAGIYIVVVGDAAGKKLKEGKVLVQ